MSSMPPWRSNPVWRRAPGVLLRFRSLFAALAVGTFLVTVVAAAYPLFLSASENELLASAIDDATVTPYGMGIAHRSTEVGLRERAPDGEGLLWERRGDAFASVADGNDSLGPVELAIFGGVVSVTDLGGAPPPSGVVEGRLFAGTDAIAHVEVIAGEEGPGVWLPDIVATPLAAGPGDEVVLHSGAQRQRVLVDGIYTSLYTQPRQGYWRLWNDDIYPCPDVLCSAPPQFIVAEPEQLLDLSTALGVRRATFAWQAPAITEPPMTLEDASELAAFSGHFLDRASPGGDLYEVLRCCGRWFSRHGASEITITQNAGLVVHEVRATQRGRAGADAGAGGGRARDRARGRCRRRCLLGRRPTGRGRRAHHPRVGSARVRSEGVAGGPAARRDRRSARVGDCDLAHRMGGTGRSRIRDRQGDVDRCGPRRHARIDRYRRRGVGRRVRRAPRAPSSLHEDRRGGAVGDRRLRDRMDVGRPARRGRGRGFRGHRAPRAGGLPAPVDGGARCRHPRGAGDQTRRAPCRAIRRVRRHGSVAGDPTPACRPGPDLPVHRRRHPHSRGLGRGARDRGVAARHGRGEGEDLRRERGAGAGGERCDACSRLPLSGHACHPVP